MKILIIGAGLIGCERIDAVQKINKAYPDIKLIGVVETDPARQELIKSKFQVPILENLTEALAQQPDWVFICTPHDAVLSLIKQAFEANANVLVEKPLGRSLAECKEILSFKPAHLKLQVGFNYRFFSGITCLLGHIENNLFGDLISVNMVLGHGNSPGMGKSWKLDPIKCGGGCLIDPGVHLLDLMLKIAKGSLTVKSAQSWSGFWKTGIEEEAHLLLTDDNQTIFNTQISLNRWRSSFRIEVNGTNGYGVVEGRGKSYGEQIYRIGERWGWQNAKSQAESERIISVDNCNDSFFYETLFILSPTNLKYGQYTSCADEKDSLKVMELLNQCQEAIIAKN